MLIKQLYNKIKLFSFFFFFFATHLLSQNINFSARADAKQVPLGGYVEVSFTLQNASLEKPQLPDFRNFNVMSGPNKGSSITVINGVKTEEKTISFTLQAKTLGVFTLAPARVIVNGKTYSTASLQIEVVKSSNVAKGNQKTKDYLEKILWFVENVETLNLEEFEKCYLRLFQFHEDEIYTKSLIVKGVTHFNTFTFLIVTF